MIDPEAGQNEFIPSELTEIVVGVQTSKTASTEDASGKTNSRIVDSVYDG
jgi:hypothetical protein